MKIFESVNKQFIAGEWVEGSSSKTAAIHNPYDNSVIAEVALANRADIDRAYQVAKATQPKWAQTSEDERTKILNAALEVINNIKEEIIEILVKETGSSVLKANIEVQLCQGLLAESTKLPGKLEVKVQDSHIPGKENRIYRKPVGVVGVISPFNFPLFLSMRSIVPAIATGNTVVHKPDFQTGLSGGAIIAKIFELAGLPAGVLNVILTEISEIGDYFIEHPIPRVISFTGSTAVGRHIGEVAARQLKRVSLELGGNSPFIVLEDADLEQAVNAAIFGKFIHQGQICMCINRIFVHRSLYDSFVDKFAEKAAKLPYGDPQDPQTIIGPIINEKQLNKILGLIEKAKEEGAELVLEGKRIGNVLTPFVFKNVTNDMTIAQTEIFGPVVGIIPFDTEEEAIQLANATEYGLSSAVFSSDLEHGIELAQQIEAGMTHVNDQTVNDEPNIPFGGEKASGLGRFGIDWVLEEFTTIKWISVQKEKREYPF